MAIIYATAAQAIAAAKQASVQPLVFNMTDHMLSRFGYGPRPSDWTSRYGRDADKWWADQVSLAKAAAKSPYRQVPDVAALGPLLPKSAKQVQDYLTSKGQRYAWDAMEQLSAVTLGLQWQSKAQLFESLVEVFSNHLNVTNRTGELWDTRHVFDRDVIRKNVTGSYSAMLTAAMRNVGMLKYLGQVDSRGSRMNENLGRELLELHTVGAVYTESDVANSARILTGRSNDWDSNEYVFRAGWHYVGRVKVLGFSHANVAAAGGHAVGDAYLNYLAWHPSTAQNLARKLCTFYVSDNPSQSLVNLIATTYLKHSTQILPMVDAIFRSDEFWASRGAKTRRPAQNAIATLRRLNLHSTDLGATVGMVRYILGLLGNAPLEAAPPTGYKWTTTPWHSAGATARMWRLHRDLVLGRFRGVEAIDASWWLGGDSVETVGDALDVLSQRLLGQRLAERDRSALLTYVGESAAKTYSGSQTERMIAGVAVLMLDSPYFTMC